MTAWAVVPRHDVRRPLYVALYAGLAAVSCAAVAVVFVILGRNLAGGLLSYFYEPFAGVSRLSEVALKAAPLLVMAQALAFGFRARVWNIGAEGQLVIGAIAGSLIPILAGDALGPLTLPAMILLAVAGGMLWAAVPALLRTSFNANEILVTLMLNSIALQLLWYLVAGPLRDPMGMNWPQSAPFPPEALFPTFFRGMRVNASIGFGLGATLIASALIRSSYWAYTLEVAGAAPEAARFAGFSQKAAIWATLMIGGAAAGLAGLGEVAGPIGQLQRVISPGYGYSAIIVAFLGGLKPLGILAASVVFAALSVGGELAQASSGLPYFATNIVEGTIFVAYLAGRFFVEHRVQFRAD